MLCEKCQKRDARVHFTRIVNPSSSVETHNVCEECSDSFDAEALRPLSSGFPGMLCEKCNEREATVHLTWILNPSSAVDPQRGKPWKNKKLEKHSLCEPCSQNFDAGRDFGAPPT